MLTVTHRPAILSWPRAPLPFPLVSPFNASDPNLVIPANHLNNISLDLTWSPVPGPYGARSLVLYYAPDPLTRIFRTLIEKKRRDGHRPPYDQGQAITHATGEHFLLSFHILTLLNGSFQDGFYVPLGIGPTALLRGCAVGL